MLGKESEKIEILKKALWLLEKKENREEKIWNICIGKEKQEKNS
ncbi:hypothetical protein [Bacillus cereus]|nr:hypothetical protein [Bacillus cereus]